MQQCGERKKERRCSLMINIPESRASPREKKLRRGKKDQGPCRRKLKSRKRKGLRGKSLGWERGTPSPSKPRFLLPRRRKKERKRREGRRPPQNQAFSLSTTSPSSLLGLPTMTLGSNPSPFPSASSSSSSSSPLPSPFPFPLPTSRR